MWVRLPPRAPVLPCIHEPQLCASGGFTSSDRRCVVSLRSAGPEGKNGSAGAHWHLFGLRPQHLPWRRCSPHPAQNIFLRRLLAQRSARSQAKHLGRQAPPLPLAEIWVSSSLSRPAEQRAEVFPTSRQTGNR